MCLYMTLSDDQRDRLERAYALLLDELEAAREAYAEAAAHVSTLTEMATGLRSVLDA